MRLFYQAVGPLGMPEINDIFEAICAVMKTAARRGDRKTLVNEGSEAFIWWLKGLLPYYSTASKNQKRFLETSVGAGIYYFPSRIKELWSGMVSQEALPDWLAGKPMVKEHEYPRQRSARDLLSLPDEKLIPEFFSNLYLSKYGRYNFVTKKENNALKLTWKDPAVTTPEEAYRRAGIVLVKAPLRPKKSPNPPIL